MITEKHIDEAIKVAKAGGTTEHRYDQRRWCGTACCVLGHARIIAGLPERDEGPTPNEIEDTPRAQRIAQLMLCPSPTILRVMEAVQADGRIVLAGADLRDADLRGAGEKVLVEDVIEYRNPDGTFQTEHSDEYCPYLRDRVHPLPAPVWVVMSGGWVVIYEYNPEGIASPVERRASKVCEIGVNKFTRLFGRDNLPRDGRAKRLHLLAIPAQEDGA